MENVLNIGNLFALSHDLVVYVENGIIQYMNPPALARFGREKQGMPERSLLPEYLLELSAEDFVASAKIDNEIMTVCRSNFGGQRLYSFYPSAPEEAQLAIHAVSAAMRELTNSMKATSDLITDLSAQYEDSHLKKYSAVLKHNSAKMKRLVNNYSLFSAFKLGQQPFHPEMASVGEICREIVEEAEQYTLHRCISITYHQTEDAYSSVDEALLSQMLLNLISNSLNSITGSGTVRVQLRPTKTQIMISVEDTGSGMPTEVLVNAFKGYQTQTDLTSGNFSAGLGLSVADAIAKLHGGSMLIESKVGVGTKVTVQFPKIADNRLKCSKAKYKVPMKEFIMTDLSTWLSHEDFMYLDRLDYEKRQARKREKQK